MRNSAYILLFAFLSGNAIAVDLKGTETKNEKCPFLKPFDSNSPLKDAMNKIAAALDEISKRCKDELKDTNYLDNALQGLRKQQEKPATPATAEQVVGGIDPLLDYLSKLKINSDCKGALASNLAGATIEILHSGTAQTPAVRAAELGVGGFGDMVTRIAAIANGTSEAAENGKAVSGLITFASQACLLYDSYYGAMACGLWKHKTTPEPTVKLPVSAFFESAKFKRLLEDLALVKAGEKGNTSLNDIYSLLGAKVPDPLGLKQEEFLEEILKTISNSFETPPIILSEQDSRMSSLRATELKTFLKAAREWAQAPAEKKKDTEERLRMAITNLDLKSTLLENAIDPEFAAYGRREDWKSSQKAAEDAANNGSQAILRNVAKRLTSSMLRRIKEEMKTQDEENFSGPKGITAGFKRRNFESVFKRAEDQKDPDARRSIFGERVVPLFNLCASLSAAYLSDKKAAKLYKDSCGAFLCPPYEGGLPIGQEPKTSIQADQFHCQMMEDAEFVKDRMRDNFIRTGKLCGIDPNGMIPLPPVEPDHAAPAPEKKARPFFFR